MTQFQNAMEVFKLLDKSNCRKCNEVTCLAFAAAVFKGNRQLSECPTLEPEVIGQHSDGSNQRKTLEQEAEEAINNLQKEIERIDLAEAASRLSGRYANGKLTLKILLLLER